MGRRRDDFYDDRRDFDIDDDYDNYGSDYDRPRGRQAAPSRDQDRYSSHRRSHESYSQSPGWVLPAILIGAVGMMATVGGAIFFMKKEEARKEQVAQQKDPFKNPNPLQPNNDPFNNPDVLRENPVAPNLPGNRGQNNLGDNRSAPFNNDNEPGNVNPPPRPGKPWLVLSNFRMRRESINTIFTVDYRFAQGAPQPGVNYVFRVQKPLGGRLTEYVDFDANLNPNGGTITGRSGGGFGIVGGNLTGVVGVKQFGIDRNIKPISGEIRTNGGATSATPPVSVVDQAGPEAAGKMFALANPKSPGRRGFTHDFSVDYQLQQNSIGALRCFWIVESSNGEKFEFDITNQIRFGRGNQSGTFKGSARVTGARAFNPPFTMYVEQGHLGVLNRSRQRVSNTVTLN